MNIKFPQIYGRYYAVMENENGGGALRLDFPAVITVMGARTYRVRYDSVCEENGGYRAESTVCVEKDYELHLSDRWSSEDNGNVKLERRVACVKAEGAKGIRVTSEFRMADDSAETFDDYQIIFPGAFYNKNDTDEDGMDDYLGTFEQDYKDDRNPGLSETVWCSKSGRYVALIRADVPVEDEPVTREQIRKRHFLLDTQIGSLGFSPSPYKVNEVLLRCDYPFCERNSFCLNVDASGWAAYKEMKAGDSFTVSYILISGEAEDLTEAGWQASKLQMDRILNEDIRFPFTMEESMRYRRELTNNSYREFEDKEDCPAGYFVHFSPRQSYGKQNILEYGFSGQQQMLAYVMLRAAKDLGDGEYRRRALRTLEFFMKKCIHSSGIPYGMYDVDKEDYIFWWTGVLFPFQYSHDREELKKYLGAQVVSSIMPVAEELKKHKGNYTRTMIESMYYLWLCYETERDNGVIHDDWKQAVIRFCDKFLEIQNGDGSWNRAYTMEGVPINEPVMWFGCNAVERGSGVIFPVEVMAKVYTETGDEKYRKACERAADFICSSYVKEIKYVGGLNDTTHKKSVKIDAVGVMFAMRSLLCTYEITHNEKYLRAAEKAAEVLSTWTFFWDVPYSKGTVLGDHGFKTTGWAGCDVIPACSYVDDEFIEFVPDVMKIAGYTKNRYLAKLAKIVYLGMQHGTSTPQEMYGYKMAGVQCEGYMNSLWLSDSEDLEFSGAVAKLKGDDNDTCNGLINGQQLATMHWMTDHFGTLDIDQVTEKVLKGTE